MDTEDQLKNMRGSDGNSVLHQWELRCKAYDYSVLHFSGPHDLYIAAHSKASLFIVGFSSRCGGGAATAERFRKIVHPLLIAQRQAGPCCQIWRTGRAGGTSLPGILPLGQGAGDDGDLAAETVAHGSLAPGGWRRAGRPLIDTAELWRRVRFPTIRLGIDQGRLRS